MNRETVASLASPRVLVSLCLVALVANVVLVGALAAGGVLKSTETGDVAYVDTEPRPAGNVTVAPGDPQFALERPTDADAYYDAVVRVWAGGPLYNTWDAAPPPGGGGLVVQQFHYAPPTFYLFAALATFGYTPFKFLLFGLSLVAVPVGSVCLLRAAAATASLDVSDRTLLAVGVATVGFSPVVSNFKIGQVTALAYGVVGVAWYGYRAGWYGTTGALLALPVLFKPYLGAPMAAVVASDTGRWRGLAGFAVGGLVAVAVSVVGFGVETTVQYVAIVLEALLAESAGGAGGRGVGGIATWSVEALRPFWYLGGAAILARLLSALLLAVVVGRAVWTDAESPAVVLALAVTTLFTLLSSTTFVDAALLLVPVCLLGVRAVASDDRRGLALVAGGLLAVHAHTYVMEVTVGTGHPNLLGLVGASPLLAALQPGPYGVVALYLACLRKTDILGTTTE